MEELKKYLETLAKREIWEDMEDFNPADFSGGNFDDAYFSGCQDGSTSLARTILKDFFEQKG